MHELDHSWLSQERHKPVVRSSGADERWYLNETPPTSFKQAGLLGAATYFFLFLGVAQPLLERGIVSQELGAEAWEDGVRILRGMKFSTGQEMSSDAIGTYQLGLIASFVLSTSLAVVVARLWHRIRRPHYSSDT